MKKVFEKFSATVKNNPAIQARFRAAAESLKVLPRAMSVCDSSVVDGHLRQALAYEKKKIDCKIMSPNYVEIIERSPMPNAIKVAKLLYEMIKQAAIVCELEKDTCRGGQGVVFRFLSRWFLPNRERRDAWRNPGRGRAGYSRGWFRGRTVKSLKEPRRFKGWKGGR